MTTILVSVDNDPYWYQVPEKIPPKLKKLVGGEIMANYEYRENRMELYKYFGLGIEQGWMVSEWKIDEKFMKQEPKFAKYRATKPFTINPSEKILMFNLSSDT